MCACPFDHTLVSTMTDVVKSLNGCVQMVFFFQLKKKRIYECVTAGLQQLYPSDTELKLLPYKVFSEFNER